jgi:hypothetical protein
MSKVVPNVSRAWQPFAESLAGVLGALQEDNYLIIAVKHSHQFVQFAHQGAFGLRIETTSNSYLPKLQQLGKKQIKRLLDMGWGQATGTAEESTPEADPDGSPNFFVEFAPPVPLHEVADFAARTLVEIWRVPHPGWMEYKAFNADGEDLSFPQLKLRREDRGPPESQAKRLPDQLLATVADSSGLEGLAFDSDGDLMLRYGSACVVLRIAGDPPCVRFYCPLLVNVEESPGLVEFLNDLNGSGSGALMRYSFQDGCVCAFADIPALPYVGAHVSQVLSYFSSIVDGLDGRMQAEFGGSTAFSKPPTSSLLH